MQGDRFGRHRQFRAAEFVGPVMADDHVLQSKEQLRRKRFTGQCRLVKIQISFRKHPSIGRNNIACGKNDYIPGNKVDEGEILLPDGEVAASGVGRYVMLPLDRIAEFEAGDQDWGVIPLPTDPVDFPLP
jgi:hypothetical protein